jgi:hypothetical protein
MSHSAQKRIAIQIPGPWRSIIILLAGVLSAHAQRYEITPLIGGMFGGTVKLEQLAVPNFEAHLGDRLSFGIAGGVRYDADDCERCNLIEFRWVRQYTHLHLDQDPLIVAPTPVPSFYPRITIDNFLGDFTREFHLKETPKVKPFVTATLGAARLAAPEGSAARFECGISGGFKVFPARHWGFRFQAEYLPIIMEASLQRLICNVGCVVILNGGVLNQFQVSVGPAFRF